MYSALWPRGYGSGVKRSTLDRALPLSGKGTCLSRSPKVVYVGPLVHLTVSGESSRLASPFSGASKWQLDYRVLQVNLKSSCRLQQKKVAENHARATRFLTADSNIAARDAHTRNSSARVLGSGWVRAAATARNNRFRLPSTLVQDPLHQGIYSQ